MPRTLRPMSGGLLLAAPLAASAADARRGEALYVGSARMENGGAPCLAATASPATACPRRELRPRSHRCARDVRRRGPRRCARRGPLPEHAAGLQHARDSAERADVVAFLAEADGRAPPRLGPGSRPRSPSRWRCSWESFVWIGRRGAARRARGETP